MFMKKIRGTSFDYISAMYAAARGGNLKAVQYFVSVSNPRGHYREALISAALSGNKTLVEWLFTQTNFSHQTIEEAMRQASLGGHLSIVEFFVSQGILRFQESLCYAAFGGHYPVIEFFISCGTLVTDKTVAFAVRGGNPDLVAILFEVLIQWNPMPDVNLFAKAACEAGNEELVNFFLDRGALLRDECRNAIAVTRAVLDWKLWEVWRLRLGEKTMKFKRNYIQPSVNLPQKEFEQALCRFDSKSIEDGSFWEKYPFEFRIPTK
eukprot:CAMPEP_0168542944 /NCGR_PEP_ID=MMETSP0413-20121227/1617_1 /TAXON_ID=136452 /ORGANISM="Filamoeba nolandi, Strain NC-AS-23-1" /LENGTH=264 /DNA_ID=CAMNT_0008572853 /DNA_START=108 /DNA_END=902 /DNA_ORIENTATION=-